MRVRFAEIGYRTRTEQRATLGRRLWGDFKALGAMLLLWQERARQRHKLAAVTEHMRRDIGLSEADILRETGKPFWRA
jgi:uncharacterized protein YjiS (DUF1127 family)